MILVKERLDFIAWNIKIESNAKNYLRNHQQ